MDYGPEINFENGCFIVKYECECTYNEPDEQQEYCDLHLFGHATIFALWTILSLFWYIYIYPHNVHADAERLVEERRQREEATEPEDVELDANGA